MTPPQDRRLDPRSPSAVAAIVVAPGMELGCLIVDRSAKGMKLRLDRELSLPNAFVIVETASGLAHEVTKAWTKGREVGVSAGAQTSLRGLVPARLTSARQAWLKVGGR